MSQLLTHLAALPSLRRTMAHVLGVLFKAGGGDDSCSSDQDPYAEKLREMNIRCHLIPVLTFDFVNLEELRVRLQHPETYSGIIFSSPRVVEAVRLCGLDAAKWKGQYAFTVGEKTADEVRRLGLTPIGSDSGTGAALADEILKCGVKKQLLLPCGNLSSNILYEKLISGGIEVSRLVVYQTIPDPNLEQNIAKIGGDLSDYPIKFVFYFSPSGISATMPIFHKLGLDLSSIMFGAIGPTTKSALSSHVKVSFVAEKPTPQHFIDALNQALKATPSY